MEFLNFLRENPVIAFMVLLALLVTVVPAAAALYGRYRGKSSGGPAETARRQVKEAPPVRFLGTQLDLAILVFGLLILLALLIGWLR